MKLLSYTAAIAAAFVLSACGGGSSIDPAAAIAAVQAAKSATTASNTSTSSAGSAASSATSANNALVSNNTSANESAANSANAAAVAANADAANKGLTAYNAGAAVRANVAAGNSTSDSADTISAVDAAVKAAAAYGSTTDVTVLSNLNDVPGTGTAVTATSDAITATYSLWLYSSTAANNHGTLIQSGTLPATKLSDLITGWQDGMLGKNPSYPAMRVGGTRTLYIPSSLGYGSTARNGIPANSGLVFDLGLTGVTHASP